jgi:DNA-binding NarL/FixJ family response regulator
MFSQVACMGESIVDEPLRNASGGRRLLVAHGDAKYVAAISSQFRHLGWDVQVAKNAADVRQLARTAPPTAVIMAADGPEETGWLTCAKLMREHASCKVILVSRDLAPECFRLTQFVGATALVGQNDGVQALVDEVYGEVQLPAVG